MVGMKLKSGSPSRTAHTNNPVHALPDDKADRVLNDRYSYAALAADAKPLWARRPPGSLIGEEDLSPELSFAGRRRLTERSAPL